MKLQVIAAAVLACATAVPAVAADGQIMRNPQANYQSNYRTGQWSQTSQCFNGRQVSGVNRMGQTAVLVQTQTGPIYQLAVPKGCPALDDARKVTLSANGGSIVCAGQDAEMRARTASGDKRCYVSSVRLVSADEARALSRAPVR